MESIDSQAKNEIHELLSELVVTPISKISNEFGKKVSNSLEKLSSKLEDNSKSVIALKGNVDKIRKSVGEDLKDDFEDKVDSITLSMRNLSGELGKIPNQIIESYKSKHDEIISKTDKIQESIKAINVEEQKKDLLEAAEQLGNNITGTSGQIEQKFQEIEDKVNTIMISLENTNNLAEGINNNTKVSHPLK